MTDYDVRFIHPPAIYDFRKKPIFPGVLGTSVEAIQFTKIPIGLLSLAEYLDRHGYKVVVDNLGDRMVSDPLFNVEDHIKNSSARIFAVGLHFQWHAQGAIEIARLCKKWHPGSLVVLGGLTATCFHREIIRKYDFIDVVIRGEAEKPFLEFMKTLEKTGKIGATPNLTYRSLQGEIITTPLMQASTNLDDFEYTRLDLLEPRTSVFNQESVPRWSLEVCRGCVYNCAICGGSAYTYKTYLGMDKPAFRSPAKLIRDMNLLKDQGIRYTGLFQDARMGGEAYWRELLALLQKEKPDFEGMSIDLLVPADEEFIRGIAEIGRPVIIHICPDTGCESVRRTLGRYYSNQELLKTIELCHKYGLPVTSFFSTGLAGETRENIEETWKLWGELSLREKNLAAQKGILNSDTNFQQGGPITGPIVLDPGSPAFDFPEKYGYKLLYPNLEEYIRGLSLPSWHQWLNYETPLLNKKALIELILESFEFSLVQREEHGFYDKNSADAQYRRLKADEIAMDEVNRIMEISDPSERESALKTLKNRYEMFLKPPLWAGGLKS